MKGVDVLRRDGSRRQQLPKSLHGSVAHDEGSANDREGHLLFIIEIIVIIAGVILGE